MDTFAIGEPPGFRFEVLFVVKDYLVRSRLTSQLCFFCGAGGADHPRSNVFCQLHQQQAHASGSSVNQCGVALLQWIGAIHQVMCRHALEHGGSGLLVGNLLGYTHETVGSHSGIFRIAA